MKVRKRNILSICLSAFLMLSAFFSTIPVYAQGTGTEDDPYIMDDYPEVANPYPDKISDAEIQAKLAEAGESRPAADTNIFKIELILKDGSTVMMFDGKKQQQDWFQKYYGQIKQVKWYSVFSKSRDVEVIMATTFLNDLRLKTNVLSNDSTNTLNKNAVMTELKINNENVDPSMMFFKWKNGIKRTIFFEGTLEVPSESPVWMRVISYPVFSSKGGVLTLIRVFDSYMVTNATFHYVDEKEYRNALNLDYNSPIAQRSNGSDWSSTAPSKDLSLTDLKDPLKLSDEFMGRKFFFNSSDSDGTLYPYFSIGDTKYSNKEWSSDGMSINTTTIRPTYAEAIKDNLVGYTYIADDIDKPMDTNNPQNFVYNTDAGKGNYYFTPVLNSDGTISYDKHYYILERQMPSPIKIHKTDDQDQGLKDVTFDLYRINGETETPVASGLITNENGDLYVSQAESVTQSDLSKVTTSESYDPQTGYIVQDDLAYLTPGTYRLKETAVPNGYKKANFDFTVKAVQDLVTDTSTPVPVQSFTFKNESAYPVEYSFVSADGQKELPEGVKALLPKDDEMYAKGDTVQAVEPETTSFKAEDGIWKFKSYDAKSKEVNDENLKEGKIQFVGTWIFSPYMTSLNAVPTIDAEDQTLTVGDAFDPANGVTATDTEDGNLTEKVEVLENKVPTDESGKTTKAGSYTVTYKVTDSKGASSTKTITVTVNPAMEELNHIPRITADDQVLIVGDAFDPANGVTATDTEDGNLTEKVEVLENKVPTDESGKTTKAGSYTVTYKVTDSKGASSTKTITVTVNPAMEELNHIPRITADDQVLTVGDTLNVFNNVSAMDDEDGELTGSVKVIDNTVPTDENGNTTEVGSYTITYQVTDSQGASSTKTITVTVNPKMEELNQIPTIKAEDKTLTVGDSLEVMRDVTATDAEDGDVTGNIQILENKVPMDESGKTTKAGSYTVTYKVTDSQGASSTKTITVTVKENTNNQSSQPEKDNNNPSNGKGNTSTQEKNTNKESGKETKGSKGTKTSTGTYAAVFSGIASVSLALLCGLMIIQKRQKR